MDSDSSDSDISLITPSYGVSKYNNIGGVTCYMNSVLHILQQTPIFMEFITQAHFRSTLINKIKSPEECKNFVIYELFRLFKISLENDDSCLTPTKFKEIIGKKNDMWNDHQQQDSQEFLGFLISQLKEEIGTKHEFIPGSNISFSENNKTFEDYIHIITATNAWTKFQYREYSVLNNMFDGLMENNKKCSICNTKNVNYEPFLTLGLSIPIKNKEDLNKTFTIEDCLNHLILEEQLDQENKHICDFCGFKNNSYRNSLLWRTPKILILHIKRFMVNSYNITGRKITNNIIYPYKDLDLSNYFNPASPYKNKSKYDLFGINIHVPMGSSNNINMGHYTSIVKNIMNNNWYLYNDSKDLQMATKQEHLQNSNAYMLFYYRHD